MAVVLVSPAQRSVTTSGTEVRLTAANVDKVVTVFISAPAANTGAIYIGDADVSTTRGIEMAKGTTLRLDAPEGQFLDLYNMWVDAATNGDDFNVSYLVKVN
jgi:hypothetical protein